MSRAQAPYHDVRGHCVERSPSRKSNTGMLSAGPFRTLDGRRAADSAGPESAAAGTCDREDWECSCCYSRAASVSASGWVTGTASASCCGGAWGDTRAAVVVVVAKNNATSLRGEVTRRAPSRSPT